MLSTTGDDQRPAAMTNALVPPLRGEAAVLGEALAAAARQFGDREAYVDGADRITFGDWHRQADAVAAELVARGIRRGDVVALMLPSSVDFAVAYAAILRVGGVATGLNTRLGSQETTGILDRCRPALVIRDATADLSPVPSGFPLMSREELAAARRGAPGSFPRDQVVPDDPAVIIWTSGTTGVPKGAWYDHRGLAAAALTAGVMSAPFDRRLFGTPFAHAGYMAKVWDQLAWGIALVISPVPWKAAEIADLLEGERITVGTGVPTQWAKLLEEPGIERRAFPRLRLGISATAPAPPELVEAVNRVLGVPLVVRYAMTESPSISGTDPEDPPEVLFHTVGRPQTGVEVAVVDDGGHALAAGSVGRVQVRGACVMRGYWRDPVRTAEALDDEGWLRTGDLGTLTPEGHLVLAGRSTDVYLRGGYNIYPLEVENVLSEHPRIARVAVVGTPAPVIGEIGVAFVVPQDAADPPRLEELRVWTRRRLADYKAPDRLEIVDALPLTAMMKVDRTVLRGLAAL
ncbi:class I adenylate-forming enzyme family protein [Streptomyces sp. NPDC051572]|uniref:class I adenylate-forming enzyme family protein n=1 Tax=unclassified Streptomyces TaxID=2593676 RepID=UPI00345044D3